MDNEVAGDGNQYDYGFRIYNPRLGRFLSVDPLTQEYPWYTPYQFAGNKPVWCIDLDGLEEEQAIAITEEAAGKSALKVAWKKGNGKVVQMVAKKAMTRTVVVNFVKRAGILSFIRTIFSSPSTSPQDAVGIDGYGKVVGTPDEYKFWDGWVGPGRRFPLPPADTDKLPQWLADYWPEGVSLTLPIQTNPSVEPTPDPVNNPQPNEPQDEDESKDNFVYRGGSFTDMNFTPRPGKDDGDGPKSGLSTFVTPLQATFNEGGKAQQLSVKRLLKLGFQVNIKPDGHASIRPIDGKALKAWAATRNDLAAGKEPHKLTKLLKTARIKEVKVASP